jgi:hypothetical protein
MGRRRRLLVLHAVRVRRLSIVSARGAPQNLRLTDAIARAVRAGEIVEFTNGKEKSWQRS